MTFFVAVIWKLYYMWYFKDMFIRRGENVYPAEIEDFLLTHPDVAGHDQAAKEGFAPSSFYLGRN